MKEAQSPRAALVAACDGNESMAFRTEAFVRSALTALAGGRIPDEEAVRSAALKVGRAMAKALRPARRPRRRREVRNG